MTIDVCLLHNHSLTTHNNDTNHTDPNNSTYHHHDLQPEKTVVNKTLELRQVTTYCPEGALHGKNFFAVYREVSVDNLFEHSYESLDSSPSDCDGNIGKI